MSTASPIDIASPGVKRINSTSPRNQQSNLTYALQQANQNKSQHHQQSPRQLPADSRAPGLRNESLNVPFGASHGAKPISFSGQPRRESAAASSFMGMGGMSWTGMSIGSVLQDDFMMSGLSPSFNSPSMHSSSYLPRMEANFWNNLKCCDTTFSNLHELVAHFEEVHKQAPSMFPYAMSGPGQQLPRRKSSVTNPDWRSQRGWTPGSGKIEEQRKQSTINMQDMDTIGEMELDDQSLEFLGRPIDQFSPTTAAQVENTMGDVDGLDDEAPTPLAANAPTFNPGVYGGQFGQQRSPQPTFDGAAGAANGFHSPYGTNAVPFNSSVLSRLNSEFRNLDFGSTNDMVDLCINEPAKNLYSADGGFNSQQYPHFNFTKNPDTTNNGDENAKKLQAQRLATGIGRQPTDEERPFKCPVIGCEKAYKNANGLRYHEKHGHSNQKLKDNKDGTFSILDPTTSMPYPGTVGMEKEKPYRCDVCGKRYKNLNGLKYHRNHSPPCNPEFNGNQLPNLHGDMDGEAAY